MIYYRAILAIVLTLALAPAALAQALLPNGQQQFVDANGAPLAAGSVYFYVPSTTTPKTTWVDSGLTAPNPNPITLDSAGRATIWGAGSYRQVVQDSSGSTIWDQITTSGNVGFGSVNNVAGLRALPAGAYTGVIRLGYTTPGDGGAATYAWNANSVCTDDGGSCVAPNSGTGRWVLSASPTVSAAVWGIFPNADVTTALQNAINYVCTNGAKLNIPGASTPYKISLTLTVGNGSSSAVSTQNGCEISGVGNGVAASEILPANAPVRLQWIGAGAGTMMIVKGPIYGVKLYGLTFDANSLAASGLVMHHPFASRFEELLVENWSGYAYTIDAYPLFAGIAAGAQHDTFIGVRSENPVAASSASGIQIGASTYSAVADVAQVSFVNCQFAWDGTVASVGAGIVLRYTDNISFYQVTTLPVFGTAGAGIVVSPPAGNTTFPGEITFYNSAILGGFANPGAGWTATNGIGFFPFPGGDGEGIPVANTFGQVYGVLTNNKLFGIPTPTLIAGSSGTAINMAGATDYSGVGCYSTNVNACAIQNLYPGVVVSMRVALSAAIVGVGEQVSVALEKNGVDTGFVCTLTPSANSCVVTGTASVVATDNLVLKTIGSGSAPVAIVNWSISENASHDGTF